MQKMVERIEELFLESHPIGLTHLSLERRRRKIKSFS
jgi:hypothetical protein